MKLLGSVKNNIEHNFVDTVSSERILQWRATIQELISVGFAVEFILDHLREIARAFFMKKVQPAVDAIDTRIETLRVIMSVFLLALVGPAALETSLLSLGFIDVVPSFFIFLFFSLFYYPT